MTTRGGHSGIGGSSSLDATASTSLSQRFGYGTSVSLAASYLHATLFPQSAPVGGANGAQLGLSIAHPILRTPISGDAVVAARHFEDAAKSDLAHQLDVAVFDATQAYWTYAATVAVRDILSDAETRARRVLDDTETLVKAGQVAREELTQLKANLAEKARARVDAEHDIMAARTALALTMGIPMADLAKLDAPNDRFPDALAIRLREMDEAWVSGALGRRKDAAAAEARVQGENVLAARADANVLPALDVTTDVAYTPYSALAGSSTASALLPSNSYAVGVGLALELPIQNSFAAGALIQSKASLASAEAARDALLRSIEARVRVSFDEVATARAGVATATSQVALSESAIENERLKRRAGVSTLIDVVLIEDRLTSAHLGLLQARVRYSIALARLELESGFIDAGGKTGSALAQRLLAWDGT